VLDINAVIYGMVYLFYEPNPDDPLNREASNLYRTDKAQVMIVMIIRIIVMMMFMMIIMMSMSMMMTKMMMIIIIDDYYDLGDDIEFKSMKCMWYNTYSTINSSLNLHLYSLEKL